MNQVREIARDPDPYSRLASSIGEIFSIFSHNQLFLLIRYEFVAAPEIYGHEDVKKALLLQLVGGVTRYVVNFWFYCCSQF
jgi:hypothetical protein